MANSWRTMERCGDSRPLDPGPKPLKARQRALTLPFSRGFAASKKQTTYSQDQSSLFGRLPLEIRLQIWEDCLTGRDITLTVVDGRLRQRARTVSTQDERDGLEYDNISLSLLLACRRSYSETIDLLYPTNLFCTTSPWVVAYLPRILIPHRLHTLRSFRFEWSTRIRVPYHIDVASKRKFRTHERTWHLVWKGLASMSDLRYLRIKLMVPQGFRSQWRSWESRLLQSATTITAPEDFELALPWRSYYEDDTRGLLPCRVVFEN